MQVVDFGSSPTGRTVPVEVTERDQLVKHFAFVPNDLPDDLHLSSSTWTAVTHAAEMLGRVDASTTELALDPVLLSRPMIRREAVSTSALEGTFAPAAEVLAREVDENLPRSPAVTEIINFIHATEYGVERMREIPIGTRFARELQDRLIRDTATDDYQRGEIRKTQVIIGPYAGCSIKDASYVPPPPGPILEAGMDAWEKWINEPSQLHIVAMVAIAHYQFEALHPFTDGNGRIGRLLAILQLIEAGILSGPVLNLSPYFERNSEEYRYRLREVSISGDWDGWVTFFSEALAAQSESATIRVRALLEWRDRKISELRDQGSKGLILEIVESLVEQPTMTVKTVVERFGKTQPASNSAINRLVGQGILTEVTGTNYNRVFQATEVIDILFDLDRG